MGGWVEELRGGADTFTINGGGGAGGAADFLWAGGCGTGGAAALEQI